MVLFCVTFILETFVVFQIHTLSFEFCCIDFLLLVAIFVGWLFLILFLLPLFFRLVLDLFFCRLLGLFFCRLLRIVVVVFLLRIFGKRVKLIDMKQGQLSSVFVLQIWEIPSVLREKG